MNDLVKYALQKNIPWSLCNLVSKNRIYYLAFQCKFFTQMQKLLKAFWYFHITISRKWIKSFNGTKNLASYLHNYFNFTSVCPYGGSGSPLPEYVSHNVTNKSCLICVKSRDGVRTESGPKKSGFCQKIKVRTRRTKVRTLTDLKWTYKHTISIKRTRYT